MDQKSDQTHGIPTDLSPQQVRPNGSCPLQIAIEINPSRSTHHQPQLDRTAHQECQEGVGGEVITTTTQRPGRPIR